MANRACGNCSFYHDGENVCLRYAPRPEMWVTWADAVDARGLGENGAENVRPSVDAVLGWCGEWERRMDTRKLGGWNPESGLFDA